MRGDRRRWDANAFVALGESHTPLGFKSEFFPEVLRNQNVALLGKMCYRHDFVLHFENSLTNLQMGVNR